MSHVLLADSSAGGALAIVLVVGIAIYFLPSIVAVSRGVNVGSVLVINIFLGWTLIGWVVALALAAGSRSQPIVINQGFAMQHPAQPQAGLPPGWYPDPWGQAPRRFWNGQSWTDQLA